MSNAAPAAPRLTELKGLLFHFLGTTEFKYLWFNLWTHYWRVIIIAISR